jgi:hypothetical protein
MNRDIVTRHVSSEDTHPVYVPYRALVRIDGVGKSRARSLTPALDVRASKLIKACALQSRKPLSATPFAASSEYPRNRRRLVQRAWLLVTMELAAGLSPVVEETDMICPAQSFFAWLDRHSMKRMRVSVPSLVPKRRSLQKSPVSKLQN